MSARAPRGLAYFLFFGRQAAYFSACFSLTQRAARGISAENTRPATSVQKRSGAAIPYFIPDTTTYTPNTTQTMPQKNSGRSQPPSGKGLSEYLLQSAKGAGSRTLFPCKLPTRRKITPRPLPCYNTDTEGRRTYKTFDRKTAAPVFRTDEPYIDLKAVTYVGAPPSTPFAVALLRQLFV